MLEVVLVTPVLILMLATVIGAARVTLAHQRVESAAAQAARAASSAGDSTSAISMARTTAHSALESAGEDCRSMVVDVNVTNFRPGGSVSVQVTCSANLGVGVPGLSGSRHITGSAAEVLDLFREVSR